MDIQFGMWNVRSTKTTCTRIIINSVCDMGGTKSAEGHISLARKGNDTQHSRTELFIYKEIISAVEDTESIATDCYLHSAERLLV
jgi:hypothetical protein